MNIYFLTFATERNKCYILENSCKINGIPLRIIGLDEKWEGFGTKYILIQKYLEENKDIDDNDFIFFNDGYDTICQDTFDQIYQKVINNPSILDKIIVSCELYLWPPSTFHLKNTFDQIINDSEYRYPCSGQYAGTKKNLLELYKTIKIKPNQDDQEAIILFCLNNLNKILFDSSCYFFQPNLFKLQDTKTHYNINTKLEKKFDPFLNEDLRLVLNDNKIFIENLKTKTKPSFIHANGPPKEYLKQFFIKYIIPIKKGLKIENKLPPCFAITMPDRKNYITSVLNTYNIPFQEFQAINGKKYNYKQLYTDKVISHPNIGLTLGEIGCYLSHANVYKNFDTNPWDKILIFEDDIRIPNYLTCKCLKEYMLEALEKVPKDCDILYLGRCYDNCGASEPINDLIIKVFNPLCLHAYVLFRKGYEKLKDIFPIKDAIDRYLVNKIQFEGLKAYATNPPFFMQNNKLKSNVQRTETNFTPVCSDYFDASYFFSDFLKNQLEKEEKNISLKDITFEIVDENLNKNENKNENKNTEIKKIVKEETKKKNNNFWIFIIIIALIILFFWIKWKNKNELNKINPLKYKFIKRNYNF